MSLLAQNICMNHSRDSPLKGEMLVLLISEFHSNNMHLELPSHVIHTLVRILKYFVREEKQQVYTTCTLKFTSR